MSQNDATAPPSPEDAATTQELNPTPTVPDSSDTWPDRLAQQLADREARRERQQEFRDAMAARRNHGLAQRHAAKLARSGGSR